MKKFQDNIIRLFVFVVGILVLRHTAEKCRQLVGDTASKKSSKSKSFNCMDGSTGSVACAVRESVKLYANNLRSSHVERVRDVAVEAVLADALSKGLSAKDAAKEARKGGEKAAKIATEQANRITGPIISSVWDFFEAIYYGGTLTKGNFLGTGTLFGTYAGGFIGEQKWGKFGYLVGSHIGGWYGGHVGLMVYDVANGVIYLLGFLQPEEPGGSQLHQ